MGCGKSKHDVASGNTVTVLQLKKSSVSYLGNGAETKDTNYNNVDSVNSEVQVDQGESVKEFGVGGKNDEVINDVKCEGYEKINVQEEKEAEGGEGKTQKTIAAEGQSQSEKSSNDKDDSLKNNEQKINEIDDNVDALDERMPTENEEDTNVASTEGAHVFTSKAPIE
ncbi:unnamed protein product [Sphenostylis stenocarpa]|uniref:Uncharacterized protein n=1 Tax=Sphenostylis stenocarpa TaxID=92480 RepID=A0AA86SRK0_9FABA|nr:unnamed protein product [Sphenostylis stenocarpa]